jgi:hypothetical protein
MGTNAYMTMTNLHLKLGLTQIQQGKHDGKQPQPLIESGKKLILMRIQQMPTMTPTPYLTTGLNMLMRNKRQLNNKNTP